MTESFVRMYGTKAEAAATAPTAAEERRRTILRAAVDLIGMGGPDAITHRAVAARARVPLGSLTYHFATREDLVRAAFRHQLRKGRAWLAEVAAERPLASLADVVQFVVAVARREAEIPRMIRADYELILYCAGDPVLQQEYARWALGFEAALAAVLEQLGAARPIDAARTVIDLLRGYELERFTNPQADPEQLGRRLLPVVQALTGATTGGKP